MVAQAILMSSAIHPKGVAGKVRKSHNWIDVARAFGLLRKALFWWVIVSGIGKFQSGPSAYSGHT